ncbi:MAG: YXWGXW repeat-containing protein, partial [Bryobacteraceae bacterium]
MPRSNKVQNSKVQTLLAVSALVVLFCAVPARSSAGIAISIHIAPPVLPVYVQPVCPAEGYIWTPGYWAWGPGGYYWVPGVWVQPPEVGLLWTPGYWGFARGIYVWRTGYWGPHVGFYGGVHYGFGYTGVGFVGGYWSGGVFRYNTAVARV